MCLLRFTFTIRNAVSDTQNFGVRGVVVRCYCCGLLKEYKYYYDCRYNYCFPIFSRGKWLQQNSSLSDFFPELFVFNCFVK